MTRGGFTPEETESIYVNRTDRYVVSLIVGYDDADLRSETGDDEWVAMSSEEQARAAARAALDLTRDAGSSDTVWFVYDRRERVSWKFEQDDFEQDDSSLLGLVLGR